MNLIKQITNISKRFQGFQLVNLAYCSGFLIPNIYDAIIIDLAKRFLYNMLQTLLRETFRFKRETPKSLILLFKEYLKNLIIVANKAIIPFISTTNSSVPLSQRCSQSCKGLLEDNNKLHLFLHKLHIPLSSFLNNKDNISLFYIKQLIYLAFFQTDYNWHYP